MAYNVIRIRIEGFGCEEFPKEITSQTRHKTNNELIADTLLFLYGVVNLLKLWQRK